MRKLVPYMLLAAALVVLMMQARALLAQGQTRGTARVIIVNTSVATPPQASRAQPLLPPIKGQHLPPQRLRPCPAGDGPAGEKPAKGCTLIVRDME